MGDNRILQTFGPNRKGAVGFCKATAASIVMNLSCMAVSSVRQRGSSVNLLDPLQRTLDIFIFGSFVDPI
jgi:hypothetical protein